MLGGRATPAAGFAAGIERAILVREKQLGMEETPAQADLMMLPLKENSSREKEINAECSRLAGVLRNSGIKTRLELQKGIKAALKKASEQKIKYCLILGENELKDNLICLKNLEKEKQIGMLSALEKEKQIGINRDEFLEKLKNHSGDKLLSLQNYFEE